MEFIKNLDKKQKFTILGIAAIILVFIMISIVTLITRAGKIATTVQFAPYAATVKLNDTAVKNKSTQYLIPGTYKVVVSFDHFETYETTITIDDNYHYIVGVLTPSDNEGTAYQERHKTEWTETEGIIGQALNEEGSRRKKQYPILNYLPVNNSLYSIGYSYDDNKTRPIVTVKEKPVYLDDAVEKMKLFKNVDLASYEIVFKTENPFAIYDNNATGSTPLECAQNAFSNLDEYATTTGQDITNGYYTLKIYTDDYEMAYQYAHYRALFHKEENGVWKIIAAPQPLLTTYNTPDVPIDILNTANSL